MLQGEKEQLCLGFKLVGDRACCKCSSGWLYTLAMRAVYGRPENRSDLTHG